jgi:predicted acyltransferase
MTTTANPERYLALDFYRGLTIALMIVVNTAGDWDHVYAPLRHAAWHGCTPTDIVFPSFMFIMGVSMWFAFARYGRRWSAALGWKILRRTLLLFAIGLFLNQYPWLWKNWDSWRIMGVPQRLALGYGLGALLVLSLPRRALWLACAALLLGYWALLWHYPRVSGFPYDLPSNAVLRLDLWLFGPRHLYQGDGIPFDPEGVLSTLPAIVTVVLGWMSGELMGHRARQKDLLVRDLLVFGLILGFVGLAWDLFLPINKKLWTSSYVLYAGGVSMLLLAGCIWLLDVRGWRNGSGFFLAFGSNALFAYVVSEVIVITLHNVHWVQDGARISAQQWIYDTVFRPIEGGAFSSFLFALCYTLLCWLLCRWLYVRRIFVKI